MTAVVLVGMTALEAGERDLLQRRADACGATLAFLQLGQPSLVDELTRLADAGETSIRLEPVVLGERSVARSWVRRVAGHWLRQCEGRPTVVIGDSAVTGEEAGLSSPAWEHVPDFDRHVLVCRGPRCSARGAADTAAALDRALGELGLGDDDVLVSQTGCLFPCNNAPVVVVHPDNAWYGAVDEHLARRIVVELIGWGMPMSDHRLPRRGAATP